MRCALILTLLAFFLLPNAGFAQMKRGQARLDSLIAMVPKMKEDTTKVMWMQNIRVEYMSINLDESMKWAARALALAQKIGWRKGEDMAYYTYFSIGDGYLDKAAYPEAQEAFFKALRAAEAIDYKDGIIVASGCVGTIFYYQKDYPKALEYYFKALKIAEERGDKWRMEALANIGGVYQAQGRYSEALEYKEKSLRIAEKLNSKWIISGQIGNIGALYQEMKQYNAALSYSFKALRIADEIGDKHGLTNWLGNIGENYYLIAADSMAPKPDSLVPASREAALAKAIEYLKRGIAAMRKGDFKTYIPELSSYLSESYALQGDYKSALQYYTESIALRDSLFNKENDARLIRSEEGYKFSKKADSIKLEGEKRALALQKDAALAALRYDYERRQAVAKTVAERTKYKNEEALRREQILQEQAYTAVYLESQRQREAAVSKAEADKRADIAAAELKRRQSLAYASYAGGTLLLIGAIIAIIAWRGKRKAAVIISAERERSESLLRNILPAEVAEELKTEGAAAAKQYDEVSVLFTDFVNFSGAAEKLSPQALIQELHECFSAFDAITERHGLEKIKTIGDAYMAVCGLPQDNPLHAQACVSAAIDIRDFMERRNNSSSGGGRGEAGWAIRIGIHSGPVVAGIVGVMKYAYDVWGDTVNTAARMEQHGEPGRINISAATYRLIRQEYPCSYRGELAVKGKGGIAMYFVEAPVTKNALQIA